MFKYFCFILSLSKCIFIPHFPLSFSVMLRLRATFSSYPGCPIHVGAVGGFSAESWGHLFSCSSRPGHPEVRPPGTLFPKILGIISILKTSILGSPSQAVVGMGADQHIGLPALNFVYLAGYTASMKLAFSLT